MHNRRFICIEHPLPNVDPRQVTVSLGGPVKLSQLCEPDAPPLDLGAGTGASASSSVPTGFGVDGIGGAYSTTMARVGSHPAHRPLSGVSQDGNFYLVRVRKTTRKTTVMVHPTTTLPGKVSISTTKTETTTILNKISSLVKFQSPADFQTYDAHEGLGLRDIQRQRLAAMSGVVDSDTQKLADELGIPKSLAEFEIQPVFFKNDAEHDDMRTLANAHPANQSAFDPAAAMREVFSRSKLHLKNSHNRTQPILIRDLSASMRSLAWNARSEMMRKLYMHSHSLSNMDDLEGKPSTMLSAQSVHPLLMQDAWPSSKWNKGISLAATQPTQLLRSSEPIQRNTLARLEADAQREKEMSKRTGTTLDRVKDSRIDSLKGSQPDDSFDLGGKRTVPYGWVQCQSPYSHRILCLKYLKSTDPEPRFGPLSHEELAIALGGVWPNRYKNLLKLDEAEKTMILSAFEKEAKDELASVRDKYYNALGLPGMSLHQSVLNILPKVLQSSFAYFTREKGWSGRLRGPDNLDLSDPRSLLKFPDFSNLILVKNDGEAKPPAFDDKWLPEFWIAQATSETRTHALQACLEVRFILYQCSWKGIRICNIFPNLPVLLEAFAASSYATPVMATLLLALFIEQPLWIPSSLLARYSEFVNAAAAIEESTNEQSKILDKDVQGLPKIWTKFLRRPISVLAWQHIRGFFSALGCFTITSGAWRRCIARPGYNPYGLRPQPQPHSILSVSSRHHKLQVAASNLSSRNIVKENGNGEADGEAEGDGDDEAADQHIQGSRMTSLSQGTSANENVPVLFIVVGALPFAPGPVASGVGLVRPWGASLKVEESESPSSANLQLDPSPLSISAAESCQDLGSDLIQNDQLPQLESDIHLQNLGGFQDGNDLSQTNSIDSQCRSALLAEQSQANSSEDTVDSFVHQIPVSELITIPGSAIAIGSQELEGLEKLGELAHILSIERIDYDYHVELKNEANVGEFDETVILVGQKHSLSSTANYAQLKRLRTQTNNTSNEYDFSKLSTHSLSKCESGDCGNHIAGGLSTIPMDDIRAAIPSRKIRRGLLLLPTSLYAPWSPKSPEALYSSVKVAAQLQTFAFRLASSSERNRCSILVNTTPNTMQFLGKDREVGTTIFQPIEVKDNDIRDIIRNDKSLTISLPGIMNGDAKLECHFKLGHILALPHRQFTKAFKSFVSRREPDVSTHAQSDEKP